jgi:hypothetical protein
MLDDEAQRGTKSAVPEPATVPAAGAEFELKLLAIAGTALLSAMPAGAASKKADGGVPQGSQHPPP